MLHGRWCCYWNCWKSWDVFFFGAQFPGCDKNGKHGPTDFQSVAIPFLHLSAIYSLKARVGYSYNCFRRLMKSTILALCLANSVLPVAADERAAGTLSEMLAKIRSEEFENNFFVGDAFLEKPTPGKESAAGCILDKACGQWCMRFTWWQEATLPDCCICLENCFRCFSILHMLESMQYLIR